MDLEATLALLPQALPYLTHEEAEKLNRNLVNQDKILCTDSLSTFLGRAWKQFDPSPYKSGWHIDVIAEHLEAVNTGEIKKLLINLPPRHCKSSLLSVAWPAWTWAQTFDDKFPLAGPQVQWMFASYGMNLSLRDSRKCRHLIGSAWYQERWGDNYQIQDNADARILFVNNKGGYRFSTSVGGAMGEGGSIIVLDDPHQSEGLTTKKLVSTIQWYDETLQTRFNDPKNCALVIIMQRLKDNDISGHVLDLGGFEHICLPARYEANRTCVTMLGLCDPREEDNEPLWPERYDEEALTSLEESIGSYAVASQLQQRPVPRGGGIIKRDDWKLYGNPEDPDDLKYKSFPPMLYIIASLDGAFSEGEENDYSALSVWGIWHDENSVARIMLMAAWHERLSLNNLVIKVGKSCRRFKVNKLLIENKASGKSADQELRRLFANDTWSTQLINPQGDKEARAHAVSHLWETGVVYAPDRTWADLVIDELAAMPNGAYDDLADTATQAVKWLRDNNWIQRKDEHDVELHERLKLKPKIKPLYDV